MEFRLFYNRVRSCWGHGLAFAGLVAAVVAYYFDYLTGRAFIWEDMVSWYYPALNYFCTAVASGRFPFWVPGLLNGYPLYTDVQTAVYYLLRWLLVLFVRDGVLPALVYHWYVVLHIIHNPMLKVYAWLPLQLWLVDKVVAPRRAKYYAGLTGVIFISFCAGFPQATLYDSFLVIAYWLNRRYRELRVRGSRTLVEVSGQLAGESWRIAGVFGSVVLQLERGWLRQFNLPAGLSVLALARKGGSCTRNL